MTLAVSKEQSKMCHSRVFRTISLGFLLATTTQSSSQQKFLFYCDFQESEKKRSTKCQKRGTEDMGSELTAELNLFNINQRGGQIPTWWQKKYTQRPNFSKGQAFCNFSILGCPVAWGILEKWRNGQGLEQLFEGISILVGPAHRLGPRLSQCTEMQCQIP